MNAAEIGIATHHSRVEHWECDFNAHWNARFYVRSFRQASERAQALAADAGAVPPNRRAVRYHRELFSAAPVLVRSLRIADGALEGWTVHVLSSEGSLSAVCAERPNAPIAALPAVPEADVRAILPRDLDGPEVAWDPAAPGAFVTEPGSLRPADLDHRGAILDEELVRISACSLQHQLARLGFTTAFTKETSISRMAMAILVERKVAVPAGTLLQVRSTICDLREKSFWAVDDLSTPGGDPVATVKRTIVAVDLERRRIVALPDFMRSLRPSPLTG